MCDNWGNMFIFQMRFNLKNTNYPPGSSVLPLENVKDRDCFEPFAVFVSGKGAK